MVPQEGNETSFRKPQTSLIRTGRRVVQCVEPQFRLQGQKIRVIRVDLDFAVEASEMLRRQSALDVEIPTEGAAAP